MSDCNARAGRTARIITVANMINDLEHAGKVLDKLDQLNERYAVVKCGGDSGIADLSCTPPDIMTPSAFNLLYDNDIVLIATKTGSKEITISKLWLKWPERKQYLGGIVFAPGKEVRRDQLNLFTGFPVKPSKGNWERMEAHLRHIVCRDNEKHFQWLMSWFADIVQNPGREKVGTAVILRGKKGTGKSIVFDQFRKLIGAQYSTVIANKRGLTGNFNKHLMTALFAQAEEAVWAGDKDGEGVLKHLITGNRIPIEPKGLDSFEVDNFTRFGFTTNADWVVPSSPDERRWFVLDVSDEKMQDTKYFAALLLEMENAGGLEAWMHALMTWEKPEWVDLRNPPKTDGLGDQILESLPVEQRFFVDAVQTGRYFGDKRHPVWKEELYDDYKEYVIERGAKFAATDNRFGIALKNVWGFDTEKKRNNGVLTRCYWLPPLDEAREIVAENLNISVDMLC